MAILNSSIVTGKLQVTDTIYENGQALSSKYVPQTYTINGTAMTGSGFSFAAGTGIDITGSTISVDTTEIATKNDLESGEVDVDFNNTVDTATTTTPLTNIYVKTSSSSIRYTMPQSNWTETNSSSASYIRNKPTIPSITQESVTGANLDAKLLTVFGTNMKVHNLLSIVAVTSVDSNTDSYETCHVKVIDNVSAGTQTITVYKPNGTTLTSPYSGYSFKITYLG